MADVNQEYPEHLQDVLGISGRFSIDFIMHESNWGQIHHGIDFKTGKEVVVKVVEISGPMRSLLANEAEVHQCLSGGVGVPKLLFQKVSHARSVMVMEMLGPPLHDLLTDLGGQFSLKTVLMLADQVLSRTEYIHAKGFIHRDIKPDNFLVGLGSQSHQVSMIDFGFAKRYWNPQKAEHIQYKENRGFVGTPAFASLRTHLGVEQSRRDDLEAVGFMLVYFLRGRLPWYLPDEGSHSHEQDSRVEAIRTEKMCTPLADVCENLPDAFFTYLSYCRGLAFTEKPDYKMLRKLFRDCLSAHGYERGFTFDWTGFSFATRTKWFRNQVVRDKPQLEAETMTTTTQPSSLMRPSEADDSLSGSFSEALEAT